jgi:plastocyanin
VVAVLEDAPAQPKVKKADPVLVNQRDMVFLPRVVVFQHGQAVRFENNDLFNHGAMASSTVKADQFDLLTPPNQPYEHTFEPQRHPVQIGCALHPWMRAWIYVVPHPWFSVSDADGKFKIEKVPPGKHMLWLRNPDTGHQQRQELEIRRGKVTEVKLEWPKATEEKGAGTERSAVVVPAEPFPSVPCCPWTIRRPD